MVKKTVNIGHAENALVASSSRQSAKQKMTLYPPHKEQYYIYIIYIYIYTLIREQYDMSHS